MSYETDLMTSVAELLDSLGIGEWKPTGAYEDSSEPMIVIRDVPDTERPLITLSTYPVTDSWGWDDHITGLQVRVRCPGSNPTDADDLDAAIYDVLHGMHGTELGGHRISKIGRASGASIGKDENERWARSSNYYVHGPRN